MLFSERANAKRSDNTMDSHYYYCYYYWFILCFIGALCSVSYMRNGTSQLKSNDDAMACTFRFSVFVILRCVGSIKTSSIHFHSHTRSHIDNTTCAAQCHLLQSTPIDCIISNLHFTLSLHRFHYITIFISVHTVTRPHPILIYVRWQWTMACLCWSHRLEAAIRSHSLTYSLASIFRLQIPSDTQSDIVNRTMPIHERNSGACVAWSKRTANDFNRIYLQILFFVFFLLFFLHIFRSMSIIIHHILLI